MKILFYFGVVIFALFVIASVAMSVMYYLQLDGYNVKSIAKSLVIGLKENYLIIILYLVILSVVRNVHEFGLWALYLLLCASTIITFLFGSRFLYLSKVKWTKRMIRLCSAFLIFYAIFQTVILLSVKAWVVVLFFPLYLLLTYLLLFLSATIMLPIENKINDGYKRDAKKKLDSVSNIIKVGITGSYGKTSVKSIMAGILSQEYSTLASEKSFNTPMGLCKTINNNLKATHEVFIAEMGAKKRGEIKELCDFISPNMGVITSVGRQHIETFGSLDNVYKTKKELVDSVSKCVFNLDNNLVRKMYDEYSGEKIGVFVYNKTVKRDAKIQLKSSKVLKLVKGIAARYYIRNVKDCVWAKSVLCTDEGLVFNLYHERMFLCTIRSKLVGMHNVTNILLACAVGVLLNVSPDKICVGVWSVEKIDARMEKTILSNGSIVLNNGYNSNLDSAKFSLQSLRLFKDRVKVVVTPGLVECVDQFEDNKEFGKMVAGVADKVIVVGSLNKDAIIEGLKSVSFNIKNIIFVDAFVGAKRIMDELGGGYVYLIENDLPDNYRK